MGLFSKKIKLMAPLSGKVKDISEIEDITFSQKFLGDGVAIEPSEGIVTSPCDAVVEQVFHTKHAISLTVKDLKLLIHVGIDTVNLKGEGFVTHVKEGDIVSTGDLLLTADLEYISKEGYLTDTAFVVVNAKDTLEIEKHLGNSITKDEVIMEVKK